MPSRDFQYKEMNEYIKEEPESNNEKVIVINHKKTALKEGLILFIAYMVLAFMAVEKGDTFKVMVSPPTELAQSILNIYAITWVIYFYQRRMKSFVIGSIGFLFKLLLSIGWFYLFNILFLPEVPNGAFLQIQLKLIPQLLLISIPAYIVHRGFLFLYEKLEVYLREKYTHKGE